MRRVLLLEVLKLFTHILLTRFGVSTSSLCQECLPLRFPKPSSQWLKGIVNIVRNAFDILATIIRIKIPMDVEDEIRSRSINIGDVREDIG